MSFTTVVQGRALTAPPSAPQLRLPGMGAVEGGQQKLVVRPTVGPGGTI